uniref:Kazal-type serine protease inhibitor SPI-1 n=1 Tax=Carcinoscorpius rotundicauda TaxID=6848 RepID=A1X1V8_CARRO|nr:Kazal-type serine protease inhibitor SPI-1 [Carcinoscorpius rotundicauda]
MDFRQASLVLFVGVMWAVIAPSTAPCPHTYKPVCGANGEVYDNECFLNKAGIEPAESWETCRGHELCPSVCTEEYDPVCVEGKIYGNRCVMQSHFCGKVVHENPLEACL